MTTSQPDLEILFIIFITRFSFPGITFAEYNTKSSDPNVNLLLESVEAKAKADLASPWDPKSLF